MDRAPRLPRRGPDCRQDDVALSGEAGDSAARLTRVAPVILTSSVRFAATSS